VKKPPRVKIQDVVAIAQTIIAALMLCSLWQTHQTLLLTKRQLESSIAPFVDAWQDGSTLHLKNAGDVTITQVEVLAVLAAYYDVTEDKVGRFQLSSRREVLQQKLETGSEVTVELSKYIIPVGVPISEKQIEAYCLVLRYRRSADLKPAYKFYSFYRVKPNSPPSEGYVYFPSDMNMGAVAAGPAIPFKNLKSELKNLCLEQLDLPGLDQ
jgi:hypothetical protein